MSDKAKTSETRNKSLSKKLASMAAAASNDDGVQLLTMEKLIAELAKQREVFKNDMSALIQDSVRPLQASVDSLRSTVDSFQTRLVLM